MNAPNLPVYLQGRFNRNTAEAATSGIAGTLPPHISILGNAFTLIDVAGEKRTLQTRYMDCCIVDVNPATSKMYRDKPWTSDATDPPTCFSHDGIVPSNESQQKQARTCAECQWNVRGSATSALSGKAIKACRDEKITAITIPGIAGVDLWQFRVTPGSFKAWRAFTDRCKQHGIADIANLMVRVAFEEGKNGVLTFTPTGFIPEGVATVVAKALESKTTEWITGQGEAVALPAPVVARAAIVEQQVEVAANPFVSSPAPLAAPQPTQTEASQQTVTTAVPPSGGRRPRRTKAEMEAARAATAPPDGGPAGTAPFMPNPTPAQAPFGIAEPSGPAPAPAVAAIDSFFGK